MRNDEGVLFALGMVVESPQLKPKVLVAAWNGQPDPDFVIKVGGMPMCRVYNF
ncbi:MAG: hypothetical protein ACYDEC_05595 [Bacteroidia bacterium]